MRKILFGIIPALVAGALLLGSAEDPFLEKPYLQLGDRPATMNSEALSLLWHTGPRSGPWSVQVRGEHGSWRDAGAPQGRLVAMPGALPHQVFRAELTGLAPGSEFEYRVLLAGKNVFSAKGRARKSADQPFTFVAFGDCAAGTPDQRAIAYQAYKHKPDFLFIAGDIVYSRGRISEYRQKFFPVYNADDASAGGGAPLLRSVLFIAAPGNHDIANRDLAENPDALAYFYYWMQPLNGLPVPELLEGPQSAQDALHKAAGANFPRMVNFSFDYGNSHWVVLDSNPYVDVGGADLTKWIEDDLKAAKNARWKFVAFHHPGFNSSRTHFQEQQMRAMSEVFERNKVDIVFTGHVHNYQRSYPLYFKPSGNRGREITGSWRLDTIFDGKKHTKPDGVIYLVTGGGGAKLYNPEQQADPKSWQEFTVKYVADTHSLTHASIKGDTLAIRQISQEGKEVDAFTVTK
jgi:3',5'-cyclic AMP phosphodiesterase CpdA